MSFWDCNPKPLEKMNSADSSAGDDAQLLANYGGYLSSIDTYWIKYYALRDLDGDGQDELLLFNRDKTLSNVAGVLNGTAREILSGSSLYLCAGNSGVLGRGFRRKRLYLLSGGKQNGCSDREYYLPRQ